MLRLHTNSSSKSEIKNNSNENNSQIPRQANSDNVSNFKNHDALPDSLCAVHHEPIQNIITQETKIRKKEPN